eukprot:gene19051-25652_t
MRPIRLSLAVAAAPSMDKALTWIEGKTGFNKAGALGCVLVSIALD